MRASDADLERVRLLLLGAAEDAEAWPRALTAFAEVCGGFSGQLIARDGADGLLFHLVTNIDPQFAADAEAAGLGDLARNPRLRIGHRAPVMTPVSAKSFGRNNRAAVRSAAPDLPIVAISGGGMSEGWRADDPRAATGDEHGVAGHPHRLLLVQLWWARITASMPTTED